MREQSKFDFFPIRLFCPFLPMLAVEPWVKHFYDKNTGYLYLQFMKIELKRKDCSFTFLFPFGANLISHLISITDFDSFLTNTA